MSDERKDPRGPIEPIDRATVEGRLREIIRGNSDRAVDDLEVRHLVRVITESALLGDIYSDDRISKIMGPDRALLDRLIDEWLDRARDRRVHRLPDEARLVGDKALFDLGFLGLRRVRGYDLEELGVKAYLAASEALELLAEDRRLRQFFKENRLLMLPIEEEATFLRQCSERFRIYADILKQAQQPSDEEGTDLSRSVPLMKAAARALVERDPGSTALVPAPSTDEQKADGDPYLEAARGESTPEVVLSRDHQLSNYERMLLFSDLDIDRLRSALEATVIDQERAVAALCDEFSVFAAGTRDARRPPAYFLVGPTGVGKNHLVESLGRLLEGLWETDVPLLTIEGPNFTYPSDINELRGATRGFIRSDEEGLLTSFHERSSKAPFSMILVDEVEKAHPQLITFFLSILDRGTTTDNRGNVLNFSNCMIFFTSNLGYSDAQQRSAPIGYGDEETRNELTEQEIRKDLRRALKPEFANRVRLLHFNRLGRESASRILDLEMAKLERRYREVHGLRIELDDTAREELLRRGFSPVFGARRLAATLEMVCNVELARKVRNDDRRSVDSRREMIEYLRSLRDEQKAFDPEEVRRKIVELTRAEVDYDGLRVVFRDGEFLYEPRS